MLGSCSFIFSGSSGRFAVMGVRMRPGAIALTLADPSDTARVELLLAELRLPAIKQVWASLAAQPKGGLAGGPFLAALAEHELAERTLRRIEAISPKPGCRRLSPGV